MKCLGRPAAQLCCTAENPNALGQYLSPDLVLPAGDAGDSAEPLIVAQCMVFPKQVSQVLPRASVLSPFSYGHIA